MEATYPFFMYACLLIGGRGQFLKEIISSPMSELYPLTVGWNDVLRFYVLSNSISVRSGRCLADNEMLCAMGSRLRLERFPALREARTQNR